MRNRSGGNSDLVPGLAAAVGFLGITAVLGWGYLWLSAIMGGALYVAAKWLLPGGRTEALEPPPVSAEQRVAEMRAMVLQIGDSDVRMKIGAICDQAAHLLQYFTDHPLKSDESAFLVRQYLELSSEAVKMYIATARNTATATQSKARMEEMLDSVLDRFQKLYSRLTSEDDVALAGEIQVLNKTLDELDKVTNTMRGDAG